MILDKMRTTNFFFEWIEFFCNRNKLLLFALLHFVSVKLVLQRNKASIWTHIKQHYKFINGFGGRPPLLLRVTPKKLEDKTCYS